MREMNVKHIDVWILGNLIKGLCMCACVHVCMYVTALECRRPLSDPAVCHTFPSSLSLLCLSPSPSPPCAAPDVEGAEQAVLEGTDFQALDVSTVVMECDHHDEAKDQKKRDILEANGFECQEVERNCFCKHVSFTPSAMPAENMLYPSYRDAAGPKLH